MISTYETTVTGTFDSEAIERALKAKDEEWLARREMKKNKELTENGFGKKTPKRCASSDNSSQVELTSYDDHQ